MATSYQAREYYLPASKIISFRHEKCANCGLQFCMPDDFMERRREDHHTFYCPNGHAQHYTDENKDQKIKNLEAQVKREQERTATEREKTSLIRREKEHAERSASTYKGQVTKIKRRVKAGVCPCCNRTFSNLAAHMETKHKDFAKEDKCTS